MTIKNRVGTSRVFVYSLDSSGQAAEQGVMPGSVLLKVSGVSVAGLEYEAVRDALVAAERPMDVLFEVPADDLPSYSANNLGNISDGSGPRPPEPEQTEEVEVIKLQGNSFGISIFPMV